MSEWLIGALASAPVWIVVALFIFSFCTVSSQADAQRVWPEDNNNDNNEW